jgi:uncharacterized protein
MDYLEYDDMVEKALRGVVKDALDQAIKNGLKDNHHFYIGFETERSDVIMPDYVRERHPEEITIVIQHQYWDLATDDKGFYITLSFDGVHEKLYVPYNALTSFMDPSVRFALQFTPIPEPEDTLAKSDSNNQDDKPEGKVITLDAFRKK